MKGYRVLKHVPVPPKHRPAEFPFRELELGDSFFVPAAHAGVYGQRVHVAAARFRSRAKAPVRFTVRKVRGGYRAWRIQP